MHWKAIALVVVTWSAPSTALAQVFEPFVETGDAVPSTALTVSDLGVPRIGADQDLAVGGTMEGEGVDRSNDTGLFVYRSGRSIEALAVRLGETLMGAEGPSTSAVDFRLLPGSVLVFRSSWVASDGIGLDGVWRWSPSGRVAPLALSRGDVAGSATLRWRVFDTLRAGPSGAAVHWHSGLSDRSGGAFEDAIGGTDGDADAAVRVAHLPGEYPAHSMFSTSRRASGSGHWALSVTRRETAGAPSARVILRDGAPIVREGELGGLDVFSVVGINDAGRVLFLGGMRGSPNSLYAFDDAASPLATPGAAVPGLEGVAWATSNFSDLRRFFVGGGGHVVVAAALDGAAAGADEALLVFNPELMALRAAVRAGDPAPGLSAIRFAALTRTASSIPENTLAINARGDVLFRAQLEGGDISAETRESLWVYHYADDSLTLLLRQGQEVEVDGAPYTLRDFGVQLGSGGQDGLPTGYADDGGVALRIDLDEVLPGGGVGRQRRFVGRADDRRQLVRIGSAPIGVPLPDAGMEDGGPTMTPATPPRGGCSVDSSGPATWSSFGMLFLLLFISRRRSKSWLALGAVCVAVLAAASGCSSVREIVADAGPHDAATARPGDASAVDQDANTRTDGGVTGADAGRDAGMITVEPPPGPVKTVRRPERARRGRGRIPPPVITISTDEPVLLVPGADEVAVHVLATGDILHRYPTQAQPYATLWLEAGGFERLVTIGAEGANVNTCTDTGVSPFAQLLYPFSPPNVTDISPLGAALSAAVLCDNTNGRLERIGFDEVGGLFEIEQSVDLSASAGGGRLVSAEAPRGDSPVLVAIDGSPGELRWVDWSGTPATVTDIGMLASSPRILGCAPSGDVCFVPNYGSASVSVVDTRGALPVMRPSVSVGAGPVSMDVQELEGSTVAVTTGFLDDSLHYLVDEDDSIRVVSESLSECGSPGHALLIPELRWVVVTCNADDAYVVRSIPLSVP